MNTDLKAIALDLDDTLLNTSEYLLPAAQRESWLVLKKMGLDIPWEVFLKEWKISYGEKAIGKDLIETMVNRLHEAREIDLKSYSPKAVSKTLEQAFYGRRIKEALVLYPGAQETLELLRTTFRLFLVTSGFEKTQQEKVQGLGIEKYFENIFYCDLSRGETKGDYFKSILDQTQLKGPECLSVGNRRDTDIGPAKSLAYWTCWVKQGEYLTLQPRSENEIPDFEISDIRDLIGVCQKLAPAF